MCLGQIRRLESINTIISQGSSSADYFTNLLFTFEVVVMIGGM